MKISVSDAKAQLTDLVRRAEAGEEIVLTRHGHSVVRLTSTRSLGGALERRAVLERISMAGFAKANAGPDAAHSQDFLYDEESGLPQ